MSAASFGVSHLLETLGLAPFRQRFPWLGPDLQTLRDTLRAPVAPHDAGQAIEFSLPGGDRLFARLDRPLTDHPQGLVVALHGLGGGSDDEGQRRLSRSLAGVGFAVLRLNLRGAGPGRHLAKGTYAASCSADLLPVFRECRHLAVNLNPKGKPLPLGAVGISLGGTVLLNTLLADDPGVPALLDGVVCISSPLDLASCAAHFNRLRNRPYQNWMVHRLIEQTLSDPWPLSAGEWKDLTGSTRPRTIRGFDALITAPRWGFPDVAAYYEACSPLPRMRHRLQGFTGEGPGPPPLLLLHAKDDPWVPVDSTIALVEEVSTLQARFGVVEPWPWPEVVITASGGHSGFHAPGDSPRGRWSDRLAALWLRHVLVGDPR